jgi:hypothetical protein
VTYTLCDLRAAHEPRKAMVARRDYAKFATASGGVFGFAIHFGWLAHDTHKTWALWALLSALPAIVLVP